MSRNIPAAEGSSRRALADDGYYRSEIRQPNQRVDTRGVLQYNPDWNEAAASINRCDTAYE